MSIGCFTEKKVPPTEAQIDEAIGPLKPQWLELTRFLRERYVDREEWKFMYGKRYGWALTLRSGKKMVTNLFPTQGGFTVQINLSEEEVQDALKTDLNQDVQEVMTAAHPYPEGRWMWIPVQSDADLKDIQELLIRRMAMLAMK